MITISNVTSIKNANIYFEWNVIDNEYRLLPFSISTEVEHGAKHIHLRYVGEENSDIVKHFIIWLVMHDFNLYDNVTLLSAADTITFGSHHKPMVMIDNTMFAFSRH